MIEYGFLFSNVQDVKADNNSTASTYISSKNNAPTNKDGWNANKNAQIGGMTVVVVTQTENVAGGNMTPHLVTHTANSIGANGTIVASLPTINNGSVPGTMRRYRLPLGTERLKFLGMRYTCAGNITACNVSSWMESGEGQVID